MYQIIAHTLFQQKICRLPGIGTLVIVGHSAETDNAGNRIKSPVETIDFLAEDNSEKGFNEFSAMCEILQKNLDENGSFLLNGIGTFTKVNTGEIRFAPVPVDPVFTPSISTERVVRPPAEHAILVGDHQKTNLEMKEFFNEAPRVKDHWWVWAIVLGAIGIGILLFYFYQHGFRGVGNVQM